MRQYKNQIDNKIIKIAFTEEEIQEFKELAEAYDKILELKRSYERNIKDKLEGLVIGELEGVNICLAGFHNELVIQYTHNNEDNNETLLDKLKFWK